MGSSTTEPGDRVRRTVASASVWITVGMLAGRLVGIVRELLLADTFGATRDADVAILLVSGPELLVTLAGSGAVGLIVIPMLLEHDEAEQVRVVRRLTLRLGIAAAAVALVAVAAVLGAATSWATAGELSSPQFRVAVVIAALAVPAAMVVVLSAALLRARDRFAAVAFATVTFTTPVLVAIVLFRSVVGVAVGVLVGSVLRYGIQLVLIGGSWSVSSSVEHAATMQRREVGSAFAVSVMQAAQVYAPLIVVAVVGGTGDVAVVNYGWRVLLIPIGLLGSLFAVAGYPSIVRLLQSDAQPAVVRSVLRPVILLSATVAAWLWVFGPSVAEVVYRRTGLDEATLDVIASELRAGAVAVPMITIGGAATTVLFGLRLHRDGIVPYLLSTPLLFVLGVLLFEQSGASGVLVAVSIYAAALAVSAVVVLARTAGFAVLTWRDLGGVLLVAALGLLGAFVLRGVLPSGSLATLGVNGVIYLVGGSLVAFGVRRWRTRSDRH